MLLIVDLDATLVDCTERYKKAGPEPSRIDEGSYAKWLEKVQDAKSLSEDRPIPNSIELVSMLARSDEDCEVFFLTARGAEWEEVTYSWLLRHNVCNKATFGLIMRPDGNYQSSSDFKVSVIKKLLRSGSACVVIDDDPDGGLAPALKELGILHLQPTWCK